MAPRLKCLKCEAAATHLPRLSFYAYEAAAPGVMIVRYPACSKHWPSVEDLITDEEWSKVVATMVAAKKLAPERRLTQVTMIPIRGAEARQLEARRRELSTVKGPGGVH